MDGHRASGTVEPAGYLISGFGLMVHLRPGAAFVGELGGGGIFTAESGADAYALIGFDFAL